MFAQSASAKCLSNEKLLENADASIINGTVCDPLGEAFLFGLNGRNEAELIQTMAKLENDTKALAYFQFRIYLGHDVQREHNGVQQTAEEFFNSFFDLLSASMLPDYETAMGSPRNRIYKSFLLESYTANMEPFVGDLSSHGTRMFSDSLVNGLLEEGPITTKVEMECFVKYDIITLDIGSILASKSYKACLDQNK